MAYSYISYPTDGTVQVFAVTMPYLEREHIRVWVDGVEDLTFTWDTDTTIRLTDMPPTDVFVVIRRFTPYEVLSTDFTDASLLDEETLDNAMAELFYIMQETVEITSAVLSKDIATNNWDFAEGVLSNVGDPLVNTDAVTLGYLNNTWKDALDALVADAEATYALIVAARDLTFGYRNQAEGFKDLAEDAWDAIQLLDITAVNLVDGATGAAAMPVGTEAQRPVSPANGHLRYSSTEGMFEGYVGGAWMTLGTISAYMTPPETVSGSVATVANSKTYLCELAGGSCTMTLPSSPSVGDIIRLMDIDWGCSETNKIILTSTDNIMGSTDDYELITAGASVALFYTGGTQGWRIVSSHGLSSGGSTYEIVTLADAASGPYADLDDLDWSGLYNLTDYEYIYVVADLSGQVGAALVRVTEALSIGNVCAGVSLNSTFTRMARINLGALTALGGTVSLTSDGVWTGSVLSVYAINF